MITFVSKERGNTGSSSGSVVIHKFRNRKKTGPIVLLIVAIGTEILLKSLVNTFSLSSGNRALAPRSSELAPEVPGASWGFLEQLGRMGAPGASCGNLPNRGASQSCLGAFWDYMDIFGGLWVFVGCFLKLQRGH